jgi:hypothetical protein
MKNYKMILLTAGSMLQSFGVMLSSVDSDNKGADDLIATVMRAIGSGLSSLAHGDEKGFRLYLAIARDALNSFLANPTAPTVPSNINAG